MSVDNLPWLHQERSGHPARRMDGSNSAPHSALFPPVRRILPREVPVGLEKSLPTTTLTGRSPLPSPSCLRGRAGTKKKQPLGMFWMELLRKAGAVGPGSQRGVRAPPGRCTVLPCSGVVVNGGKRRVNEEGNEPEVRSQVPAAALAGSEQWGPVLPAKKNQTHKPTHKASELLMESQ